MKKDALATRLVQYINALLPDAHGHQRNAFIDFVAALIGTASCCQATIARSFDNFEAAAKRLSRFLHNERLDVMAVAMAHAQALIRQLPTAGLIRIAIDWTIEEKQHLLVASVMFGRRAVPLYWKAYAECELKNKRSGYEREFIRKVFEQVLCGLAHSRFIVTTDRGFADVETFDLLNKLGVAFVCRTKANVKIKWHGKWVKLGEVVMRGNQRRRALGRCHYCESDPRRLFIVQSRTRDQTGRWSIWNVVSNRNFTAFRMCEEYAKRFSCEEGFRDAKWVVGFKDARIQDLQAWARMFTLVAIALLLLANIGCRLMTEKEHLRRVTSRRTERAELSIVRAVIELLKQSQRYWEWLNHSAKLNLEATL